MLTRLLDLADRHNIHVTWQRVPGGGACVWYGDDIEVVIDPTLPDHERVNVLAHELGHALSGRPIDAQASELLRHVLHARCERRADEVAADLTVDAEVVRRAAETVHDLGGHVTAAELAAELEVPVHLAELAVAATFGHEVTRFRAAQRSAR